MANIVEEICREGEVLDRQEVLGNDCAIRIARNASMGKGVDDQVSDDFQALFFRSGSAEVELCIATEYLSAPLIASLEAVISHVRDKIVVLAELDAPEGGSIVIHGSVGSATCSGESSNVLVRKVLGDRCIDFEWEDIERHDPYG